MIRKSVDAHFQTAEDGSCIVYVDRRRKPGHVVISEENRVELEREFVKAYWVFYGGLLAGLLINVLLLFVALGGHYYFISRARKVANTLAVSSRPFDQVEGKRQMWRSMPPLLYWSLIVSGAGMIISSVVMYAHVPESKAAFGMLKLAVPVGVFSIASGLYIRHRRNESNNSLQARRP